MAKVQIRDIGKLGLVTDQAPHELPQNAFTTLRNVAIEDGYIRRMRGQEEGVLGTPAVAPVWLFPAPTLSTLYWVYTDNVKVYVSDGTTQSNITRQTASVDVDYTATLAQKWSATWLSGVMVLNNQVDIPQMWNPMTLGTKLQALTAWPTDYRTKFIRPFGRFLFAGDITKGSDRYPTLIKWSHPADPGAVPASWNETDPTKLAGEFPLSDTSGFVVDGLAMRQSFLLYKEDAIIAATPTGDNDIFRWDPVSLTVGALSVGCVKEIRPGVHVALSLDGDLNLITASSIESVATDRIRRQLRNALETDKRTRAFLATHTVRNEVWVFVPESGNDYCTKAFVWNWQTGGWTERETRSLVWAQEGPLDTSQLSSAWSAQTQTWAEISQSWNSQQFTSPRYHLVGGFPLDSEMRRFGETQKLGSNAFTSRIERLGLGVVGSEPDGTPRVNYQRKKIVTEIWPIVEAESPITVMVSVGGQDTPSSPVEWQGPFEFNTAIHNKVDFLVDTHYIAVRFDFSDEVSWKFHGYGLNVEVGGEFF